MQFLDPKQLEEWANPSKSSAAPIARELLETIRAATDPKPAPPKRRQRAAAPLRLRWVDELIEWCRERGIRRDGVIADYLGINRATLWRWKNGGHVTDANILTIIDKTGGQIDPRRSTRRPSTVAQRQNTDTAISTSRQRLDHGDAVAPQHERWNKKQRADLAESRRKLDLQNRKDKP